MWILLWLWIETICYYNVKEFDVLLFILITALVLSMYLLGSFLKSIWEDLGEDEEFIDEKDFTDEEIKIILQMCEDGFLERDKIIIELLKEKKAFPIDKYNTIAYAYMLDYVYKSMLDGTCEDQRLSVKDLYERKYKDRR